MSSETIIGLLLFAPVILFSLTIHEFWHACSAYLMGDNTAQAQGRLTLNPLAHLDPIGTLCLFFAPIGWARPVPINPMNFRNPGRGMLISSAAGPASNLVVALLCALTLRGLALAGVSPHIVVDGNGVPAFTASLLGYYLLGFAAIINFGLALFNLLPLYPLDGHHIARESLHGEARARYIELQKYSGLVLVGLIMAPYLLKIDILGHIIWRPLLYLLYFFAGDQALTYLGSAFDAMRGFSFYGFS